MTIDAISYNAIFDKIIIVANTQKMLIEDVFKTLSSNENPAFINNLERVYGGLAESLSPNEDLLVYQDKIKKLNSELERSFYLAKNHYENEVKDSKKTGYFDENKPQNYELVLQECLRKGEEIRYIFEKGKTVSDFQKIPNINLKPSSFLIRTYRRSSKNDDDFYKSVSTSTANMEGNFNAVYSLLSAPRYKVDNDLVDDVLKRIKYALYEQFKANPDLLSEK